MEPAATDAPSPGDPAPSSSEGEGEDRLSSLPDLPLSSILSALADDPADVAALRATARRFAVLGSTDEPWRVALGASAPPRRGVAGGAGSSSRSPAARLATARRPCARWDAEVGAYASALPHPPSFFARARVAGALTDAWRGERGSA
jgi:WD40 repeat protein